MRVPSSSTRARAEADQLLLTIVFGRLSEGAKLLACLIKRRLTSAGSHLGTVRHIAQRFIPFSPAARAGFQPLAQNLKPGHLGRGYRDLLVVAQAPAARLLFLPGGLDRVGPVLLHDP